MNSFGRVFRVSIYGESHGPEIGVIIDSCPPGILLTPEDFETEINRRSTGKKGTSKRKESDIPIIKSGVYNNYTTGAPILICFENKNIDSSEYEFDGFFRPGHADYTSFIKSSGYNDPRGGGHFSGRLTLPIIAAGVIARKLIKDVKITAVIEQIGGEKKYEKLLDEVIKDKDSLGGVISCTVKNVQAGLGEPFFNSIESNLSAAIFSIPGVKAIEFGMGINSSTMRGSEYNDLYYNSKGHTKTNNSGGINGGITNGNEIFFRSYIRPTASIGKPQLTYNMNSNNMKQFIIEGRHDACFALRVPPIIEAIAAIVIADFKLLNNNM